MIQYSLFASGIVSGGLIEDNTYVGAGFSKINKCNYLVLSDLLGNWLYENTKKHIDESIYKHLKKEHKCSFTI